MRALHRQRTLNRPQVLKLQPGALGLDGRRAAITAGDRMQGPAPVGLQCGQLIVQQGTYVQGTVEQGCEVHLAIAAPVDFQGVVKVVRLLARNVLYQGHEHIAGYRPCRDGDRVQAEQRVALIQ